MEGKIKELGLEERVAALSSSGLSTRDIADALKAEGAEVSHMSVERHLQNGPKSPAAKDAGVVEDLHKQLADMDDLIEKAKAQIAKDCEFSQLYLSHRKTSPLYVGLPALANLQEKRAKIAARLRVTLGDVNE